MSMCAEDLFSHCEIGIVIKDDLQQTPGSPLADQVEPNISLLESCNHRSQVFYDEVLEVVMIVKSSSSECHGKLSNCLFDLLCRLQPVLEVSYVPSGAQLVMTGSSGAFQSVNPKMNLKPPILPTEQWPQSVVPNTAQNRVLRNQIFGDGAQSNFDLLCHASVLQTSLNMYDVAYVEEQPPEPLLCLTAITALSEDRHDIPSIYNILRNFTHSQSSVLGPMEEPTKKSDFFSDSVVASESFHHNLFKHLVVDSNMANRLGLRHSSLFFPSARAIRSPQEQSFDVKNDSGTANEPVAPRRKTPTQVFRKIVPVASGFHLRMLSAHVPRILQSNPLSTAIWQLPGSEEKSLMLSIEISTDHHQYGFVVDSLSVTINGDPSATKFISWYEIAASDEKAQKQAFPVQVESGHQHNFLFLVMLSEPEMKPKLNISRGSSRHLAQQLAISVQVSGQPFSFSHDGKKVYNARNYQSKWNCFLDIAEPDSIKSAESSLLERKQENKTIRVDSIPSSPFPSWVTQGYHSLANFSSCPRGENTTDEALRRSCEKPLPPLESISRRAEPELESVTTQRLASENALKRVPKSDPMLGVAKHVVGHSYVSADTEYASRCKGLLGNIIVTLNVNGNDGRRTILHAGDVFTICMFFYNSSRRMRILEVSHGSNSVPKMKQRIHTSESQQIIAMDNNIRVGPLYPQKGQSVTMHFVALATGLVPVTDFCIEDIESGLKAQLRTSLMIAVK